MSTYEITPTSEITRSSRIDDLTAEDLVQFLDECGRLDVRITGDAAARPFAVLNLLRDAGFLYAHTWVETDSDDDRSPVTLRVTAVLVERARVPECGPRLRSLAALRSVTG